MRGQPLVLSIRASKERIEFVFQTKTVRSNCSPLLVAIAQPPTKSVRKHGDQSLFAALFKGADLLMIARFDQARAEDEIESYCRSAVAMFIAAHGRSDRASG